MTYPRDSEFVEIEITKVDDDGSFDKGWSITRADGWSFFVPAGNVEPHVGSTARFYGPGIGGMVRGLYIDGRCVYYRTKEEQEEKQEIDLYGANATDLLQRWDNGKSVFSVSMGGFGPGYEQALQLCAFEILRRFLERKPDASLWKDEEGWAPTREELYSELMPKLDSLGLSGAQWGAAQNLAVRMYRDGPQQ